MKRKQFLMAGADMPGFQAASAEDFLQGIFPESSTL